MRDPIDLLTPSSVGPDPRHRRHVLDATLGELRRRQRRRRERTVAVLAATIAAGVLLFAVLPPPSQPQRVLPHVENGPAREVTSAVGLEWSALDRPEEAKTLYRKAGERYVAEGDLAGAVRSYGGSLDAGTTQDLETTPNDDWLLSAIKLARKKETER